MIPITFTPISPAFGVKRRRYATIDGSKGASRRRTRQERRTEELTVARNAAVVRPATLIEIDRDPTTGQATGSRQIPATFNRRTGQFTGYDVTASGLLVTEAERPHGPLILPGDDEATPPGPKAKLILPDAGDDSTRQSINLLGPGQATAPLKMIKLDDPDAPGLDELLMKIHDTHRQLHQPQAGPRSKKRKPQK